MAEFLKESGMYVQKTSLIIDDYLREYDRDIYYTHTIVFEGRRFLIGGFDKGVSNTVFEESTLAVGYTHEGKKVSLDTLWSNFLKRYNEQPFQMEQVIERFNYFHQVNVVLWKLITMT